MIANRRMRLSDVETIYRAARVKLIEELIEASNEYRGSAIVLRHQHTTERQALAGLLNQNDLDRWGDFQVVALRNEAGQFDVLVEGGIRPGLRQSSPWLFVEASMACPRYADAFEWEAQTGELCAAMSTYPVKDSFAVAAMNIVAWLCGAIEQIDESLAKGKQTPAKRWGQVEACTAQLVSEASRRNPGSTNEAMVKLFGPTEAVRDGALVRTTKNDPEGLARAMFAGLLMEAVRWAKAEARAPRRRLIAFRQSIATMCGLLEEQLRHRANLDCRCRKGEVTVSWRDAAPE